MEFSHRMAAGVMLKMNAFGGDPLPTGKYAYGL